MLQTRSEPGLDCTDLGLTWFNPSFLLCLVQVYICGLYCHSLLLYFLNLVFVCHFTDFWDVI